MDHKKIERINELARKKRTVGLTEGEVKEQAALRQEYLDGFKANMQAVLDSVRIQRPDGTRKTATGAVRHGARCVPSRRRWHRA